MRQIPKYNIRKNRSSALLVQIDKNAKSQFKFFALNQKEIKDRIGIEFIQPNKPAFSYFMVNRMRKLFATSINSNFKIDLFKNPDTSITLAHLEKDIRELHNHVDLYSGTLVLDNITAEYDYEFYTDVVHVSGEDFPGCIFSEDFNNPYHFFGLHLLYLMGVRDWDKLGILSELGYMYGEGTADEIDEETDFQTYNRAVSYTEFVDNRIIWIDAHVKLMGNMKNAVLNLEAEALEQYLKTEEPFAEWLRIAIRLVNAKFNLELFNDFHDDQALSPSLMYTVLYTVDNILHMHDTLVNDYYQGIGDVSTKVYSCDDGIIKMDKENIAEYCQAFKKLFDYNFKTGKFHEQEVEHISPNKFSCRVPRWKGILRRAKQHYRKWETIRI